MKTSWLVIALLCLAGQPLAAQIGGRYVFEFILLPHSARATALGDYAIAVEDDDAALAYQNPSVLNREMHQALSFSHNFYMADIGTGYASYTHHFKEKEITAHAGIHYISYGDFELTDEIGNRMGTFEAGEYAIVAGLGKKLYDRLSVGANLRFVMSRLESYNASGIGLDLAATYRFPEKKILLSLVARNAGFQLGSYTGERETVPFDLQLGFSKRLKYLPFRFYVTAHTLNRWDIRYDDPSREVQDVIIGEELVTESENEFLDNFFRHLVFAGEFLLGKEENFRLRIGYNHLRKKELAIDNYRSLNGFSFGAGFRVSKFILEYGFGKQHIAGGAHHLSISTSLDRFRDKALVD